MPAREVFRLRVDRLDELTSDLARRRGDNAAAEGGSAFTLDELLAPHGFKLHDRPAAHFGPMTTRLWWLTYVLFVGGNAVDSPERGFESKSVLLADTFEKPIAWTGVAHLSVWATGGPPVLVPFPTVPEVLLAPAAEATFEEARRALIELALAMVDRVNLVVPVARTLAQPG
jgi:hypothetical protein